MMHRISHWLSRHAAALFFPAALILYDFSAYLTTDLIQPGILHVVRDFNADVALAPASVSLYMAGGMALQWLLGPLSDRIGRRPVLLTGALIFTLACLATLFTTSMTQFLIARFVQGTSICFIATVGYVTVQEAFEEKRSIRLMAVITSVVLVAPIVGPLSGAALMHFIHWKALFGIIAAMGLVAWLGLLLTMPETVRRGDVPFSPLGVLRDFRNVFRNRIFLLGAATLSLSYIPLMSWVAVSPVIFNGRRRTDHQRVRLEPGAGLQRRYHRQPVGGALGKRPYPPALCPQRGAGTDARPGHPDRWQSGMAPRLAVVGARHLLLRLRHRADFPDAVSLYPLFQRPAERHGLRLAEYRDPQRQRVIN
ncbi:major facilitator superfamily protein [Klebsiella pneumoniae]|nr:major facilitator superfamily protein [Klebsiella pneumoniae]